MPVIRAYRHAIAAGRRQDGFTMIAVMITMLIVGVMAAAALNAAAGDSQLTGNDLAQKQAYLAAKSGIADYELHLNQDPNYWTTCPTPAKTGIGTTNASYAVSTLLSGTGGVCTTAPTNPVATLIEQNNTSAAYGTFRIKSTGSALGGKVQRTIYATFQSRSFLDFVYYTKYETLDPSAYPSSDGSTPSSTCDQYYYNGRPLPGGTRDYCTPISFITGDSVNGPMHSNDTFAICGSPSFGRATGHVDTVETSAPAPGFSAEGNTCTNNPTFNTASNTLATGVATIDPPPTNAQLAQVATYSYTGQTHITLNGNNMTVTNAGLNGGSPTSEPIVANTVVWVSSSTGACSYNPTSVTYTKMSATWAYPGAAGCGNITVDGSYSSSLTIASDNDIIVDGNVTLRQPEHATRSRRPELRARVSPVHQRQQPDGLEHAAQLAEQPDDRRRDPGTHWVVHGRQLQLWLAARLADGERRDCADLPRHRRHVQRLQHLDWLLEELLVQRQPPLRGAAALHRADRGDVARRPRDGVQRHRVLAGGQGLEP